MRGQLRLPAVLSVAVLTAVGVSTAFSCGGDSPRPDGAVADAPREDGAPADATECVNYCFPDGTGTGTECPFPTCATGPADDICPEHCSIGV